MSITVSLPSLFHEQVMAEEPRLIEWGVSVAIDEDRNSTLVFPGTAELAKHIDGDRRIAMITMRDAPPSMAMASWTFNEEFITKRTGGHR